MIWVRRLAAKYTWTVRRYGRVSQLFLGLLAFLLSVITYLDFETPFEVDWLSSEVKRIAQTCIIERQTRTDMDKQLWK